MRKLQEQIISIENSIILVIESIKEIKSLMDYRFTLVDERLKEIDSKIDSIKGGSNYTLKSIEIKLEDLSNEVSKINEVTRYQSMFNNMSAVKK